MLLDLGIAVVVYSQLLESIFIDHIKINWLLSGTQYAITI